MVSIMKPWNAIDHMNAAKANKPTSGGTNYPRAIVRQSDMNRAYPKDSHSRFMFQFKRDWQWTRDLVLEDLRRTIYPERYEEFV